MQGVLQGFRVVGTGTKLGKDYPVVAYRYGGAVELEKLLAGDQDDCERYESLPQHRQEGAGGFGAARLSCQAAPVSPQWEQHLQSLYAEINEKWIVQRPGTIHFIKQKNKNRHAKG